jgi:hypothetical protein
MMKEELAAVEQRLKVLEEQVKTIVTATPTPTSRIKTETGTKIKTEPETKPKSEFKPQQTLKSELKGPVTPETLEVSLRLNVISRSNI